MTDTRPNPRASLLRHRLMLPVLFIYLAVSAAIVSGTALWMKDLAETAVRERSTSTLNLVIENIRGELSKFIYMPKLLSSLETIPRTLAKPNSTEPVIQLNEELSNIANLSGAQAIYVLNDQGRTIAASNATAEEIPLLPRSTAQPYFIEAMQGRLGRHYGIDPAGRGRSYFFAHPIRQQNAIIGVVVIQVELDNLEPLWFSSESEILVVDRDGIVFLSSRPEWRFRTLAPLDPARHDVLAEAEHYGRRTFEPLPFLEGPSDGAARMEPLIVQSGNGNETTTRTDFLVEQQRMLDSGWQVVILADAHGVRRQIVIAIAAATSVLVIVLLVAANIYQRRRRMIERLTLQEAARQELEVRVRERTRNLTETTDKLRAEVEERRRAEAELKTAQAELVQASKMAALGQMAAGLSHELNQPLAAIRSYAENAVTFLERERTDTAKSNLSEIAELTDRMARIIKNLRTYSRNEQVPVRAVRLQDAVDEALALLDTRLSESGTTVQLDVPSDLPPVMAGDVRLQQVFVNLFTNAIDAMSGRPERIIKVRAHADADGVQACVEDTGPGVPSDVLENVFDPFYSTKDVGEGMGLGLSITYGIVRRFGGVITVSNGDQGGAVFTITLPRAVSANEAAE